MHIKEQLSSKEMHGLGGSVSLSCKKLKCVFQEKNKRLGLSEDFHSEVVKRLISD